MGPATRSRSRWSRRNFRFATDRSLTPSVASGRSRKPAKARCNDQREKTPLRPSRVGAAFLFAAALSYFDSQVISQDEAGGYDYPPRLAAGAPDQCARLARLSLPAASQ